MNLDDAIFCNARPARLFVEPRCRFSGDIIAGVLAVVGAAASLAVTGDELYNIATAPSAGNVLGNANVDQSTVISSLTGQIQKENAQLQTLQAEQTKSSQTTTLVLLGAGAVVLYLVMHKKKS
jgi:hypothetical protein